MKRNIYILLCFIAYAGVFQIQAQTDVTNISLKTAIAQAKDYAGHTNYPGKPVFEAAIATARAVYDNSADQRANITTTIADLDAATLAYRQTRPSFWTTVKNGALWKDIGGNEVQAHGAGFLQVGDKWYMAGEDRSSWNAGVNLYSSDDLVTWKFERKIIPNTAYSSDRFIERPKLLRCPSTGKFVVWCHYEQSNYGASEAASFVCDSVNGLYTLHFSGRPLGIKSRDCNVFVDADDKAYFVSTTDENQNLTLFELSTDYLDPVKGTRLTEFDGKQREAPAIVRIGNTYFLISSSCTGWDPNQGTIAYSTSLTSGWSSQSNIGNGITFDTQAASVLTIKGTEKTTYLYVGDRWQDPGLAESKTIIFPISFSGNTCTFNYKQQFDIDFATGQVRETPVINSVPKNGWTVRAVSSQETSSEYSPASYAFDGNISTKWHTKYGGSIAPAPHWLEIDMGTEYEVSGFLAAPRMDNSTNGLIRTFLFYISTDGTNWKAVAGGSWLPYYSEVNFAPIYARYFRLVSLSGTYASLAEIDILQNTETYTPQTILPYYKIGTGTWQQSKNINANLGDSITFGPNASSDRGSWAFLGPNNHIAAVRQYGISKIISADRGVYTSIFLNAYNKISKQEYALSVPTAIDNISTVPEKEIARKYYTLLGVEVPYPTKYGIYIVEITFESKNVKVGKIIYNKR